MKFIRWKAVLPTVIILTIAVVFTVFFADGIIKKITIDIGESVFGAKVEISSLKTKLKNMSVEIKGLQIANKEDVWKNILVIDRIGFSMETIPLLSKKIIVNEMTAEGVEWGTARKTSGALPPRKKKKLERKRNGEDTGISDRMMASLKNKASEEASNLAIISDIKSFQKNIKELIEKAKLKSQKVMVIGLTEINEQTIESSSKFENETIRKYNAYLKEISDVGDVDFVDMRDVLDIQSDLEDGLHLNAKGYKKMFNKILSFKEGFE